MVKLLALLGVGYGVFVQHFHGPHGFCGECQNAVDGDAIQYLKTALEQANLLPLEY